MKLGPPATLPSSPLHRPRLVHPAPAEGHGNPRLAWARTPARYVGGAVLVMLLIVAFGGSVYLTAREGLAATRNVVLSQTYGRMAGMRLSPGQMAWPPPAAATGGGTIEGKVRFAGVPAPNAPLPIHSDPGCLEAGDNDRVPEGAVIVNVDGTLRNVFVHLTGSFPGTPPPPAETLVIDQKGCVFRPRVGAARVGQTLSVLNSDGTFHNVHGDGAHNFNVGQPRAGMKSDFKLKTEEILRLRCHIHPWMIAFVGVVDHPYFAVTGDDGAFHLRDVPHGRYVLQAWHERFGILSLPVDVGPGGVVKADFSYSGTETPPQRSVK